MNRIGIVIIGRNEGERLRRCLQSVSGSGATVVYVDSGSSDGSVELAEKMGAALVALDMSVPFTAARARNAGFERLMELEGKTELVQFVDGDCELRPEWLEAGAAAMAKEPKLAAVCGQVRERFPEASVYNRLCDLEWNGPAGEVDSTGGIAMMRVKAFLQAGGFDATVPAGEEPELCARFRQAGWTIRRLDAEMTWHDVAMLHFGQWWKRQVRTGYGGLDVARRFGQTDPSLFRRIVLGARLWSVGLVALAVVAGLIGAVLWDWRRGLGTTIVVLMLWLVQAARIALRTWRSGQSAGTALAYGALTVLSKWAQFVGQVRWWRDHRLGRMARLIEYKTAKGVSC